MSGPQAGLAKLHLCWFTQALPLIAVATVVVFRNISTVIVSIGEMVRSCMHTAYRDELPPRGGFMQPETLVLAGLRFRRRCHYRQRCHSVLGFLQG